MRYVIALGGNALEKLDDYKVLGRQLTAIATLFKSGNQIVLTHGNGPQVGELADLEGTESLAMLTAQTQAGIGIKLQRALTESLSRPDKHFEGRIGVLITRVLVDLHSKAFRNPTKPIGKFFDKEGSARLMAKGYAMKKLIGGYRRVVPSPKPIDILDLDLIEEMLGNNRIVIACGGGGIPMVKKGDRLDFAEAVIDKDRTAALLGIKLHADALFILTNVDGAYANFKKRNQKLLGHVSLDKIESYLNAGMFEEGSMKPKVESCVKFVRETSEMAVIGNFAKLEEVMSLDGSTVITA